MVEIMLSMKPKWWQAIVKGEKTVEIRKTIPRAGMPFIVQVYETQEGRGMVVGNFAVHCFWADYKNSDGGKSGLTDDEILKYGQGKAYGLEISDLVVYKYPYLLSQFGLNHAPQSWCYVKGCQP